MQIVLGTSSLSSFRLCQINAQARDFALPSESSPRFWRVDPPTGIVSCIIRDIIIGNFDINGILRRAGGSRRHGSDFAQWGHRCVVVGSVLEAAFTAAFLNSEASESLRV
ncbi:hypothetical protein HBI56_022410 [Parastagonospora nodorum]|uniref:Uncharacterized protein n=1 Tax=Phaeosphaeria nodorum (strain SN15 / ATCC MYA-4574 / FGSC 10173) TaxID=321614 RepID=A0A7U2F9K4_PHANO|nr:hypothetical protein HBH56_026130 [Parastagonospora nodorum]QRC98929.1 hypothetical protein JI435_436510 [Parastagonospora nodorum SN15]KAH3934372.1 hypothetical protein HBH54_055900 [Parastagonospora nodorum]KAH3949744.1 hypothetical protein HBH53_083600 [Parastagonospora nodorum]KAH3975795.1 hypothetical protein HBH51_081780 [Parastagonospora nodorum]